MDGYLKERRLQLNLTLKKVAAKVGVSEATVSRWEGGQIANMKRQYIAAYAAALQTTPGFIMTGKEEQETDTTRRAVSIPPGFMPLPRMVKKPLVGRIACGEPITAEQNIESYVDVPEGVPCDFCLECQGDSMIDAGIHSGDVVIVQRQDVVEPNQIAVVCVNGDEATLKRFRQEDNLVFLSPQSYNPAHQIQVYDLKKTPVHIMGRVVQVRHNFQ